MEFFFLQLLPTLALIAGGAYWQFVGKHESYLRRICVGLPGGDFRAAQRQFKEILGLRTYSFIAKYLGRQVVIDYRFRPIQINKEKFKIQFTVSGELEIQFPLIQKFWLRMLPEAHRFDSPDEIQLGNPAFDRCFLIHSNQAEAAKEFLKSEAVQEQLRRLPMYFHHMSTFDDIEFSRYGFSRAPKFFDRMEIHRGWLKVLILQPEARDLGRLDLEFILDVFAQLVLLYEAQYTSLRILAVIPQKVCPYCRGEFFFEQEEIYECGHCGTHLHASCWKENGQCTTWGCTSSVGETIK